MLSLSGSNIILFTSGDNDSFPLWYLQEKENYRKDVLVLNENFLTLPYYITMLEEKSDINLTISGSEMHNSELAYVLLGKNKQVIPTFEKFISEIKSNLQNVDNFSLNLSNYGNYFDFKFKDTSLMLKVNPSYVLTNEIVLLDIISSNPDNAIYVMNNTFQKYGLEAFIKQRSIIKELTNKPGDLIDSLSMVLLEKDIANLDFNYLKKIGAVGAHEVRSILMGMTSLEPSGDKRTELYLKMLNKIPLQDLLEEDYLTLAYYFVICKPMDSEKYTFPMDEVLTELTKIVKETSINKENVLDQLNKLSVISSILSVSAIEYTNNQLAMNSTNLAKELVKKLDEVSNQNWIETMPYTQRKRSVLSSKFM
jgi:hypothetical protein